MSDFVAKTLAAARSTELLAESIATLQSLKGNLQLIYASGMSATYGDKALARGFVKDINKVVRAQQALDKSQSPIKLALDPQKTEAQDYAEEEAAKSFAAACKVMDGADWNLDVVAPYPDSRRMGKTEYRAALAKRNFYSARFGNDSERNEAANAAARKTGNFRSSAAFKKIDMARRATFLANARDDAGVEFEMYVGKLCNKIGACVKADYQGILWQGSILTITKEGGKTERWHTQQIINRSVLGTLFHQWPTRLLK